jgi:hypothetical protein
MYKELDVQDRLDTLQTEFEILAGKSMSRDVDKFARASAMALISCAIDSLTTAMQIAKEQAGRSVSRTVPGVKGVKGERLAGCDGVAYDDRP